MARLADFPPEEAEALRRLRLPEFDGSPWVSPPGLSDARLSIISTAGLHRIGDPLFGGGVGDYRIIPGDIDYADLAMSHVSTNFDRSGFQQDVNVVFPLEHVRNLAARDEIGSVGSWHYSFMGATDPVRMEESAHDVARLLRQDGVDVALLVPV